MRLDRFLSECGICTRSEAAKEARHGNVTVNGKAVRSCSLHIDENNDRVTFCGEPVVYRKYTYIMLNKPEGYVSSTDDKSAPTVLELLPEELRTLGLFPCGRLDRNTLGFILLTNNGKAAHYMLSPKRHVKKEYAFELESPLSEEDRVKLEGGIDIGGYLTKPCSVRMTSPEKGVITLGEGKYHQIKRMAEAVGNRIVYLERISFAGIALDEALSRGEWRYLNEEEKSIVEANMIDE